MNFQTFGTTVVVSAMESFMVFVNITKGRVSKLLGARMVLLSLGGEEGPGLHSPGNWHQHMPNADVNAEANCCFTALH